MNLALTLAFMPRSLKRLAISVVVFLLVLMAVPVAAFLSFTNVPLLDWIAPSSTAPGQVYADPITAGDEYDYGYCTYWAQLRRIQNHDPIPNNWGDAITWSTYALLQGYLVDHTPSPGAIFQWPDAPGGEGHVAYVESVDPSSGAWTISEMNAAGWDIVDNRKYPASQAIKYNFIHDKERTNGI